MDNLDVIVSGPTPKNPSDIFLGKKFSDLIENLKKKDFDKLLDIVKGFTLKKGKYIVCGEGEIA